MKKIGIVLFTLVLLVALSWAGITYAFSRSAEPCLDTAVEFLNKTKNGELKVLRVEKTEYTRGFLSSTAKTSVYPVMNVPGVPEDLLAGEDADEKLELRFVHRIYHGPVAITPDGKKICQSYVITTLDQSNWNDEVKETVADLFGKKEPLTIRSLLKINGDEISEFKVAAVDTVNDDVKIVFGGITGAIHSNAQFTTARGNFEIAGGKIIPTEEKGLLEVSPSSGSFDYSEKSGFSATVNLGKTVADLDDEGAFEFASSTASLQIENDSAYKGNITFGKFRMNVPDGKTGNMKMVFDGIEGDIDFRRLNDKSPVLIGKGEIRMPKLAMKIEGADIGMEDYHIKFELSEEAGKMQAMVRYGIGSMTLAGPEFVEMEQFTDILKDGGSVEVGIDGIDLAVIEKFAGHLEQIETELQKSNSDSTLIEEVSNNLIDLVQPGFGFYYDVKLGDAEGLAAKVEIKMGGDKKLTELKTTREMASSVEGNIAASISGSALALMDGDQAEMTTMLEQYKAQGLFTTGGPNGKGYQASGKLINGVFKIGSQTIPLLGFLGASVDEPIRWDEFMKGMQEGIKDAIKASQ